MDYKNNFDDNNIDCARKKRNLPHLGLEPKISPFLTTTLM